ADVAAEAGDAGGDAGSDASATDATDSAATCTCVPNVPPGWTGPTEIFLGGLEAGALPALPPCPGGGAAAFSGFADARAPAAVCSCTCGTPTGVTCQSTLQVNTSGTCTGASCGQLVLDSGACVQSNGLCGANFAAAAPVPFGGSCAAVLDASVAD